MQAQSRNRTLENSSIIEQSKKLRTAAGWMMDINGNWVENQNAIANIQLTDELKSGIPQNFKWLQFVLLNNVKQYFYTLLYENTIHISGSRTERRVHYYLMDADAYKDILSTIEKKNGETLSVHSTLYGYMSDSDNEFSSEKLMKLISQTITDKETNQKYVFKINAQHVDNEDVLRFRLPETILTNSDNLKSSYFETKLDAFNEIILPEPKQSNNEEFELNPTSHTTLNNEASKNSKKEDKVEKQVEDEIEERTSPIASATVKETKFGGKEENNTENTEPNDQESEVEWITNDGIAERHTKENALLSKPVSDFSEITGWYLNNKDEWVDENNLSYQFETVGRYQTQYFRYHEKDYILLTRFEKYAGSTFYLIDKTEYEEALKNLETSSIIRFPLISFAGIGYTLDEMIKLSEEAIDKKTDKEVILFRRNYLVMQYKLSEEKNITRFFIYLQQCSQYNVKDAQEKCTINVSSKIKYFDEPLLGTDALFKKMYYESSYKDFISFFHKPLATSLKGE